MSITKRKELVVFDTEYLQVGDYVMYKFDGHNDGTLAKVTEISELYLSIALVGRTSELTFNSAEVDDMVTISKLIEDDKPHNSKECDYCSALISSYGDPLFDNDEVEVSINWREKELDISAVNTTGAEIYIHYCPMCGRKLGDKNE